MHTLEVAFILVVVLVPAEMVVVVVMALIVIAGTLVVGVTVGALWKLSHHHPYS